MRNPRSQVGRCKSQADRKAMIRGNTLEGAFSRAEFSLPEVAPQAAGARS